MDLRIKSGLSDTGITQGFIYIVEQSLSLSLYCIKSQILMGLAQRGKRHKYEMHMSLVQPESMVIECGKHCLYVGG